MAMTRTEAQAVQERMQRLWPDAAVWTEGWEAGTGERPWPGLVVCVMRGPYGQDGTFSVYDLAHAAEIERRAAEPPNPYLGFN